MDKYLDMIPLYSNKFSFALYLQRRSTFKGRCPGSLLGSSTGKDLAFAI